jgi:molybdopterin-guanine dinucleotide biosynthesis protein B
VTADWTPPANCFGIVGWKNSGKTTMTARLVTELTARGFRVATIKHAHHAFEVDDGETDSAKHRRAGAAQVGIVSPGRWALVTEKDSSQGGDSVDGLRAMLARLDPADVILIEGFKTAPHLKLEVRRQGATRDRPLAGSDPSIVAVAADHAVSDCALPTFAIDDVPKVADLVLGLMGLPERKGSGQQ